MSGARPRRWPRRARLRCDLWVATLVTLAAACVDGEVADTGPVVAEDWPDPGPADTLTGDARLWMELYVVTECFGAYSHDDTDWWWWYCGFWDDFPPQSEEVHSSISMDAGVWTVVVVGPDLSSCNTTGEFTLEPSTRYTWKVYDFPLGFDSTSRACE